MPQLLALIFDLDGTLVDSAADLRQALNALLATHGRRNLTLDEVKSMTGDGLHVLMQHAFSTTGAPMPEQGSATIFDDFLQFYRTQKASPEQLYKGAQETLVAFRAKGIKIGLCTNKLYQSTLKLLAEIGIYDLFDFIAGGDSFEFCKPHPAHVLGVARGLDVSPSSCVMIGDSINDIGAARAAHVASVAVAHGYGQDVGSLGADTVIAGFADLPDALRSLGFDFIN